MSELTPQSRAFLEAHKSAGQPTAADADRVRAALEKRLALSKAAPAARSLTGLKVGVLVTVGLAGALLVRGARTEPAAPPPALEPAPPAVVAITVPPEPKAAPVVAPVPTTVTPRATPKKHLPAPQTPAPVVAAESAPEPPIEPPAEPLDPSPSKEVQPVPVPLAPVAPDEFALVSEAEDLLRQGQPQAALEVLARWAVHFGKSGQFEQEALAGKIVALCASGDLEAGREEARRFFMRFPQALHRNRIERACAAR